MTTAADVITEAIRLALSGHREEVNKLAVSVSSGATSLSFQYPLEAIRAGALINIDTETYRVWEANGDAKTATVEPAWDGTTTAAHADDSIVYVNPRHPRAAAFKALNDEIIALSAPSSGLYGVTSIEFAYQGAVTNYDLTGMTSLRDVWRVSCSTPGPEQRWVPLTDWHLDRNANTTDFPSGNSLYVPSGIPGQTIRVVCKIPFVTLTTLSQDIATVAKIPAEMHDILSLGVLLRLGPVREIKRNFTEGQGDARRAEEVGPGAVFQSYSGARLQREMRIRDEVTRLYERYPPIRRR